MSFRFDPSVLSTLVGGKSAIDIPRLNIHSIEEANQFILAYGYDLNTENDAEKLWYFYRRVLVLFTEQLGIALDEMPEVLRDRKELGDIRRLLLFASDTTEINKNLQKWSCALLRAIHVFVHAENDLFSSFSEEIQKQILGPLENCIIHDGSGKTLLKNSSYLDEIELFMFEYKPFKTSASTVVKLLAKSDAIAMKLFDRVGIRFVTKSIVDSFRVIRFLVEQNLVSFPHIMPDQSSNNLYPESIFIKVCDELIAKGIQDYDIAEQKLNLALKSESSIQFLRKENEFSGDEHRFIKFIARKLIYIPSQDIGGHQGIRFFYPYEIQIMDQNSYQKIMSGPSEHSAYKERQRAAAKKRLFP